MERPTEEESHKAFIFSPVLAYRMWQRYADHLEARLKQAEERSYDLSLKFIRERAFIVVLGEEIGNHIKGLREVENISQAHPV
uniref:Uncharacterized protein n=1 Tax=viral metagenome TaxID=1070528 RepID=A0A6M3JM42_9ZZZZ